MACALSRLDRRQIPTFTPAGNRRRASHAAFIVFLPQFLVGGLSHYRAARDRKNRLAVRLGLSLFASGIVVGVSGLALIHLAGMPQFPTGTLAPSIAYFLPALVPLPAVALYVLHRRAG